KEQKAIRAKAMEKATKKAIAVPMEALEISYEAVLLSDAIGKIGNPHAVSDAGVAAINANAAAKSAYLNVKINMQNIKDEKFRTETMKRADELLAKVDKLALTVEKSVSDSL
ncbi:MAG: cyclodeaminase/cyclohydrolase family protein, partial [Candidatus Cloacimonadota bacterium]|nr:cyclodeaminase/cyclohydrolase family protein [Candidatus Cloacimonadota bacterium]